MKVKCIYCNGTDFEEVKGSMIGDVDYICSNPNCTSPNNIIKKLEGKDLELNNEDILNLLNKTIGDWEEYVCDNIKLNGRILDYVYNGSAYLYDDEIDGYKLDVSTQTLIKF